MKGDDSAGRAHWALSHCRLVVTDDLCSRSLGTLVCLVTWPNPDAGQLLPSHSYAKNTYLWRTTSFVWQAGTVFTGDKSERLRNLTKVTQPVCGKARSELRLFDPKPMVSLPCSTNFPAMTGSRLWLGSVCMGCPLDPFFLVWACLESWSYSCPTFWSDFLHGPSLSLAHLPHLSPSPGAVMVLGKVSIFLRWKIKK